MDILGSQVHPIVQVLFPNNDAIFKDNDLPCPQPEVFILGLRSMKMHFNILLAQLPNLNVIEPLCSVLESRVTGRFPPSFKQLEDKWYIIPLETIHNLHEFIPRRVQAVLQANVGPTPH